MQSKELRKMRESLQVQHAVIHKAFQGLPKDTSAAHPVLYHAVLAAASTQSAALDALQVLAAVLRSDDPKGA